VNQPPITNRPASKSDFLGSDEAIKFPEEPDRKPEVIMGKDVDEMSFADKRRYEEMMEGSKYHLVLRHSYPILELVYVQGSNKDSSEYCKMQPND
jgi:hypothetical protein